MAYTPVPRLDKEHRVPKQQAEYLVKSGNMNGEYLGACLESIRWGSQTTVMYEFSVRDLVFFIGTWMAHNPDNFERLFHLKNNEAELPHIVHEQCPAEEAHIKTIRDRAGRLRCAESIIKKFKPSYVISYNVLEEPANSDRVKFYHDEPRIPSTPDCDLDDPDEIEEAKKVAIEAEKEMLEYDRKLRAFEAEEATLEVLDPCYAIIDERNMALPLETIIQRLNLNPESFNVYCGDILACKEEDKLPKHMQGTGHCWGHKKTFNETVFPFSGWYLAALVEKWWEQGQAPWFENR